MRGLWTVARLEWLLHLRGRGFPLAALAMALVGIWEASDVREQPWGAWGSMGFTGVLVSLVLTLSTGDQVSRDRVRRVDGVLLSTPVSTAAYVCGKYLAALAVILGLVGISLVGAVIMNQVDAWHNPPAILGHSTFPPLGPWPYIASWLWLIVPPTIFGAAFVLAGLTLGRGQRVPTYAGVLVLWLGPMFFGGWPELLDVTGARLYTMVDSGMAAFKLAMKVESATGRSSPSGRVAMQVIHLVQQTVPPHLPTVFLWNRATFLGLATLLVAATVGGVRRQRQGHA